MHIIRYSRDVLAPSSNCSIFIETPLLAGFASQDNGLSIAPIGLTNIKFEHLWFYLLRLVLITEGTTDKVSQFIITLK
jgi:hypothetical protein